MSFEVKSQSNGVFFFFFLLKQAVVSVSTRIWFWYIHAILLVSYGLEILIGWQAIGVGWWWWWTISVMNWCWWQTICIR